MSNKFDAGAILTPRGWIGFYREVHWSSNHVLRDGRHDIIFATEAEAKDAALKAFLEYLNSPIVGIQSMGGSKRSVAKKAAEKLFSGGGKVVDVERKARASA